ncbi:MAG: penicillin-binding protein 1C [Bacteroidia bacterium]|nr:penicillin-binding protein 1C [Bacteroidia bacterium]MDW8345537.1 penicillin-binding protein 1C [Bacteroidia bacterium]
MIISYILQRKKLKNIIIVTGFLSWIVLILNFIFPIQTEKPYATLIYSQDKELIGGFLSTDEKWRMELYPNEVVPELKKAILFKEDKWFYWHFGINPVAILRAAVKNTLRKKRTSGASTITMQVVRLLYPHKRTYWNKFKEMLRAIQLEMNYSKNEILLMYLNYIPYGGNVEGVKAAAYLYFQKPPDKLSLNQIILLSLIPNRPNYLRIDKNFAALHQAKTQWIEKYKKHKVFDSTLLNEASKEPTTCVRHSILTLSPQLSYVLKKKYPERQSIYTTIRSDIQKNTAKLLKKHVSQHQSTGVTNGAALIVDNKTHQVVAYCASADPTDLRTQGLVNGIEAIRSPGSTLKPLVYGLAIQEGYITPQTRLLDVPTDFGGYSPQNFDNTFQGEVSARYALINSLNVPTVRLARQIGIEKIIQMFADAHIKDAQKRKKQLGLSAVLGGIGTNLEELTAIYTAFAHQGVWQPLRYLVHEDTLNLPKVPILTPEANFIITDMLSKLSRPDMPTQFSNLENMPKIAWKTGTSYGKKDAWAIGYNPVYTVGVWLGNFSGKGISNLSAAQVATPLLFDIFYTILHKNQSYLWFKAPKNIDVRYVCSETGLLPSAYCPKEKEVMDVYIPYISPNAVCDRNQLLYTSTNEQYEYCKHCLPKTEYIQKVYPILPPELVIFYQENKINFSLPPPHNPTCDRLLSIQGPQIISPLPNYEYVIEKNNPMEVVLQAASESRVRTHFWYINGVFYRKALAGEKVFYKPHNTITKITCTDEMGRSSHIILRVKWV